MSLANLALAKAQERKFFRFSEASIDCLSEESLEALVGALLDGDNQAVLESRECMQVKPELLKTIIISPIQQDEWVKFRGKLLMKVCAYYPGQGMAGYVWTADAFVDSHPLGHPDLGHYSIAVRQEFPECFK
jgi:hypothetical protein